MTANEDARVQAARRSFELVKQTDSLIDKPARWGYLCEIADDTLHLGVKAIVFGAVAHGKFVAEKQGVATREDAPLGESNGLFTKSPLCSEQLLCL